MTLGFIGWIWHCLACGCRLLDSRRRHSGPEHHDSFYKGSHDPRILLKAFLTLHDIPAHT